MSKSDKVKRRKKSVRMLKSGHLWVPFILFSILFFLVGVLMVFTASAIMDYLISSKFLSEYEHISYMAQVYEDTDDLGLLIKSGRSFLLLDEDGKTVYENGENTCSFEGGEVGLAFGTQKILCYTDTENNIFSAEDGHLNFDADAFVNELLRAEIEYDKKITDKAEGLSVDTWDNKDDDVISVEFNAIIEDVAQDTIIFFPLWMSVPTQSGSIVAETYFIMNMNDIIMAIVILGGFAMIVILAVIIMIINLIRSISQQRRGIRLLTTDFTTGGRNWMWLVLKGERYLRSGSAARKPHAIVNLSFVEYRTYCVCHSVDAGDKILYEINRIVNKELSRGELCVHATSSNFALMMRCPSLEQLKDRLNSYIDKLTAMGGDNNLHFQIGIAPVPVYVNQNGRVVRRKDFDIEAEYNNACAARSTMANKSESGIAVFDEKLLEEKRWVSAVTEKQKAALANEEFIVYYQPKYDPVNDRLKGAEALVRWQSPDFGFVSPGKFIPIFEDNGFITEIDHYMLKHVARDQKRWLDSGLVCVPVSVNVSRAHFIESDLAEQIRDIVDAEGTPHDYIEIELTESAFFDDKNALVNTITRLQSYGFSVSMDDFGSGYSSLNSLKDMPLDVLKLDAEFFRGENAGERGKIVVSEAIRLAKDLNMRVVAEGVEEKGQVAFLASQGCDMIQGFIYAEPMEGDKYVGRMKDNAEKIQREESGSSAGNTADTDNAIETDRTEDKEKTDSTDNTDVTDVADISGGTENGQDI